MNLFFIDKDRSIRTSLPLLFQRPGTVYSPAANPDNRLTMAPRPDVPKRTGLFSLHREVFTFAAVPS